ncbi:hypothetical protein GCM10020331_016610 [Ectobacillus funiculus]
MSHQSFQKIETAAEAEIVTEAVEIAIEAVEIAIEAETVAEIVEQETVKAALARIFFKRP